MSLLHTFRSAGRCRLLPVILLLGFSLTASSFSLFKRKKKQAKQEVKKDAYQRALTDHRCDSAKGPFMSLYKTDGKLLMELPPASLGRDMLIGATISSVSNPQLGEIGLKNSNLVHIRFIEKDSAMIMQVVNTELLSNATNAREKKNVQLNYDNLDFYSFPIKARNKANGGVLFDVSSFFLREDKFFPVIAKMAGQFKVNANLQSETSRIASLKVFENNASVEIERNYLAGLMGGSGQAVLNDYPVSIGVNFTLALLPEKPMTPRLSDTRIGMFLTSKMVENDGLIERVTFVNRWRIEPQDTAAYFAGQLTEPVKPIVYYIENTFPKLWKDAIKAGVLRWNKAFERIGFKNVMQVKDFPTDDPKFDPDNFKYNCIRYLPVAVENAMGPSWVDPRSGEIVNATILVYNDVINTINNWRFVQTAQLDPAARATTMPDSIIAQSLEYVIAHEVGHTLGFMHNMAASAAFPTDSLRSATFTREFGTTPSIMDYARFNYVAQPEDKGVCLTPPFLGAYDYYALEWAYRVFPHSRGYKDDAAHLLKFVDAHAGNPLYRYGLQQTSFRYDPSAIEEDLSDDPIKAGTYGMKNLNYILKHFDSWIKDGDDGVRKAELYREIMLQAYRYVRNIYANIPGVYLYQTSESSRLPRYRVVPKAKQRASALWLLAQARQFGEMGIESVERKLPDLASHPFRLLARNVQSMAMAAAPRLAISHYLDSTSYSPLEYLEDVYQDIFRKTLTGEESLTEADIAMQRLYVDYLKSGVDDMTKINNVRNLRAIAEDYSFLNFGNGYGEPETMWAVTIDRTSEYLLHYAQQLEQLLSARIKTTKNADLHTHYTLLHKRLEKYLNPK